MKKRFLLVVTLVVCFALPASGEHIGIYQDEFGYGCSLPTGFNMTAAVVLKYAPFTTGVRFRIEPPAGTSIAAFTTPYITIGSLDTDMSLAFGQCIDNTGSISLGTITANWTAGTAWVRPALGQTIIMKTDCNFNELPIYGCYAFIGTPGLCCEDIIATESSTWGKVKSLYR
ncbi:MAG TPA: hypothetical protein VF247_02930 [Candidatus Krumholzibacteria bacterium]